MQVGVVVSGPATVDEKIVHIGSAPFPPLVLVAVDLPDGGALYKPTIAGLPIVWEAMPTSAAAASFGGAWLASGKELGMIVPFAIVAEESNVIINTRHPEYLHIELTLVRPIIFDGRMVK